MKATVRTYNRGTGNEPVVVEFAGEQFGVGYEREGVDDPPKLCFVEYERAYSLSETDRAAGARDPGYLKIKTVHRFPAKGTGVTLTGGDG